MRVYAQNYKTWVAKAMQSLSICPTSKNLMAGLMCLQNMTIYILLIQTKYLELMRRPKAYKFRFFF